MVKSSEYPDEYLKGIPSENDIVDGEYIGSHLFEFLSNPKRNDDFKETSINWHDDSGAINEILKKKKQKKDKEFPQFKAGYAILKTNSLNDLVRLYELTNMVSHERSAEEHNKYHGNILAHEKLEARQRTYFQSAIALRVKVVRR